MSCSLRPLRYRMLAIDIDGTLVNSADQITPATAVAIRQASEAGIRIVLATGRRYRRTLPLVEPLSIQVPLITASGALVKDPLTHRTLYRARFSRRLLASLLAILARDGHEPVLYADTFDEGFDFYCLSAQPKCAELAEYLRLNPDSGREQPSLFQRPPTGIFSIFVMGPRRQMLDLNQQLTARLPGELSTCVLRSPHYSGFMCEIAPAGVTKWTAIRRLARRWRIPLEAICAVGDDVNDIPMIHAAGLGVAMGNALPEVKAVADRVTRTHDDDGVAQVVGWLLDA